MFDTAHFSELPKELLDSARGCNDITYEDGALLYTVDQGFEPHATVSLNHWLAVRDGNLVMEVSITQCTNARHADRAGVGDFAISERMGVAQALQVVAFWRTSAEIRHRINAERTRHKQEQSAAFNTRPLAPWEVY